MKTYYIQPFFFKFQDKKIQEEIPEKETNYEKENEEEEKCDNCKSDVFSDCKFCGCQICGGKEEPENQLFCESCEYFFHTSCLDPPLDSIPEDDWFCSKCETEMILEKSKKKEDLETENS